MMLLEFHIVIDIPTLPRDMTVLSSLFEIGEVLSHRFQEFLKPLAHQL